MFCYTASVTTNTCEDTMNYFLKPLIFLLIIFSYVTPNLAQRDTADNARKQSVILSDIPEKVDRKARYLFYLHGKIVEAGNTRPTSEKFGVYEYEQILEAFRQSGFVVISEPRKKDTDIEQYGRRVAEQVEKLLKAGVSPKYITVVGASQGSWITMLASTYLNNRKLNFVIIAGCNKSIFAKVNLHGNVLSIYEKSDGTGTCEQFRDSATNLGKYKELELNTGLGHGFIYRPMKEWIEPSVAWAQR